MKQDFEGFVSGDNARKLMKLLGQLEDEDDYKGRLVKKSLPAKPEWIKQMDDMENELKEAIEVVKKSEKMMRDMIPRRKKLWAQIELELDDFGTDKRWNSEKKEIEIMADPLKKKVEEKGQPVVSPFQKGEL